MAYADKAKAKACHQRYYQRHKDRLKLAVYTRILRLRYKTTPGEMHQIFQNQHGLCAICDIRLVEQTRSCHVDHDHLTGKVRGLLCENCNLGLGHFKDNSKSLQKAIEYVVKHNGR